TVASVRSALAHGLPPFAPGKSTGGSTGTASTTTTTGPVSALRTIVDAGRVNDPSETVPFTFPAHAGDVIWISTPDCDTQLTIPQVAAHDVYLFDAHAGDLVHISGPGCDIGPSGNEMTLNTETADGKPAGEVLDCSSGRSLIQRSGTYEIVVNFANHGPGSYS